MLAREKEKKKKNKKRILASVAVAVLLVILLACTAITYADEVKISKKAPQMVDPLSGRTSHAIIIPGLDTTPAPALPFVPPPENYSYPYQYVYANLAGYDSTAKAGESLTIEGKVSNTGSKDGNSTITVNIVPKVCDYDDYPYYPTNVVDPTWVSVTPGQATLEAGDTEYFNISVSIPETASAGSYEGMMAITSDDYPDWEYTLYYNVQVYKLLNELVVETFSVPPNSSKLVATVSWSINENELSGDGSTMDVKLYNPGGEQISPEAEMTRISGYVDAYSYYEPTPEPGTTKNRNVYEEHTVRYLIENPGNGTWRLEMQPMDMMNFNYNIVVNPITEWY